MTATSKRSGRGAVSSGHPETTAAGISILRDGGNAMDALVGAALAAGICEPLLTGLGGGGLITYRDGTSGEVTVLDFMSIFPGLTHGLKPRDFFALSVDYGPATQTFHAGKGAAAVPGVAVGLEHAHRRFGQMPLSQLGTHAARLAREGWVATKGTEVVATMLEAITTLTPESAALFSPGGVPLQEGDVVRSEAQAQAIEAFAREGAAPFVSGRYAQALVREFGPPNGSLSLEDLAAYRVVERAPVAASFHGSTLYSPPPPCLGGPLLAFGMGLLGLLRRDDDPVAVAGALASVMMEAERAREEWFDEGAETPGAVERLLGRPSMRAHRKHLLASLQHRSLIPPRGPAPGSVPGNTTHISVVDAAGNAASYTSSNGESCGTLWPDAGMPFNNFLGEEDINPLGFHLGPPAKRLPTMMSPSLLVDRDGGVIALGTGGANRIRTAMLQVLAHLLVGDLSLEEAVMYPRLHMEAGAVAIEDVGQSPEVFAAATGPGITVAPFEGRHLYFGGVHCAARSSDGLFEAVGDPRRSGCGDVA
ncbi:MAG: gamma-glutamyltransferase [Deltaproteobacteria bacterium]|nr:gamma-glutamyltransferase [Deltaproteobacteria bacterium]